MNQIKVGDKIPMFTLPDQDGNLFDISTVVGKKKLVLFFYPKDNSLGCTREACYFQDMSEAFEEADAMIIGISGQSSESHKNFAEKNNLRYTLLSDKGDKIRKLFGVPWDFFGTV
ncbi:MAG: peroxiredoxin, partial [Bacteroidales bacterium]|nr:peroxiredoxin [Bacteroidales bacterium]